MSGPQRINVHDLPRRRLRALIKWMRAEANRKPSRAALVALAGITQGEGRDAPVDCVTYCFDWMGVKPTSPEEVFERLEALAADVGPIKKTGIPPLAHPEVAAEAGNIAGKFGEGDVLAAGNVGEDGVFHSAENADVVTEGQDGREAV